MKLAIAFLLIALIFGGAFETEAKDLARESPMVDADYVMLQQIADLDWGNINWDKSSDESFWVYAEFGYGTENGVVIVKNGSEMTAIWGLMGLDAEYKIVTDDLINKTQAFTAAVNSTELKVSLVENPYRNQGYYFFFRQNIEYNGTKESIEAPILAMKNRLEEISPGTIFRNLRPAYGWFWDSDRNWAGSTWSR